MLKTATIGAAFCAMLLVYGVAQAAAGFTGPGSNDGNRPVWGDQLTPEQRQQMEKIFNDNFSDMDETRQMLAAKRQALDEELRSPNPNPAKIETLSREIGELRGKMLAARVAVRSQLEKAGLPGDFYGPGAPRPEKRRPRGPEVWHGGRSGHGHGHHNRSWRGCPGGCW